MQEAIDEGYESSLSEEGYFDLVYRLKADVEEFIDRNPNKFN